MERNKIRVLIVEDDPDFCFLIQNTLRDAGMEVVGIAGTASGALTQALEKKPDIVLMDLRLSQSGLEGIEAGKAIRLRTRAKVLILTSYEDIYTVRKPAAGHLPRDISSKASLNCWWRPSAKRPPAPRRRSISSSP